MVKVITDHSAYLLKRLQFHQQRPQYEGNLSLDTHIIDTMAAGATDVGVGDGMPIWYACSSNCPPPSSLFALT